MALNYGYEYINEEAIDKNLKCKNCGRPFVDPVLTKCKGKKHTFCRRCIEERIRCEHSCPTCRQQLDTQDFTPITDGVLVDMLDELLVKCISCKMTGLERGNFDAHKNGMCRKVNIECPSSDIACAQAGTQNQFDNDFNNENRKLRTELNQLKTQMQGFFKTIGQLQAKIDQQEATIRELDTDNGQLKKKIYSQGFGTEYPINDNKQFSGILEQQHAKIEYLPNVFRQEALQPKGIQIGELDINNRELSDKIYSKRYQSAWSINYSKQLDGNQNHHQTKFEWFPNVLKRASVEALQLQRTQIGRLMMYEWESKHEKDPQKFQTEWPLNDDNQNQQQNQLEWYTELFSLANAFGLQPKQTQFAKLSKDDLKYKIYPQKIPTGGSINDNRQLNHNQTQEQIRIERLEHENQELRRQVQQLLETAKGKTNKVHNKKRSTRHCPMSSHDSSSSSIDDGNGRTNTLNALTSTLNSDNSLPDTLNNDENLSTNYSTASADDNHSDFLHIDRTIGNTND